MSEFVKHGVNKDKSLSSVISWLLEDESPEVKYRAMTELLGMSMDAPDVKEAHANLLSSNSLSLVMDKFNFNHKWEDANAFLALTEFGLTRDDVPIDGYIERLIKNISLKMMKCAKVLMLRNLVSLGYYEHPWVREQISQAFSTVRQDGTIRCLDKGKKTNDSKLQDMGCYRQTATYLLLAAELKKLGVILPQYEPLIRFFTDHNVVYRSDDPEKVIIREMTETFFPIDHVHIGLHVTMYGLSVLGGANHPNCGKAWALLYDKKNTEDKYILSESFENPYFDVGIVGHPNKWVTLYILLAEKYRTL